MKPKKTADQSLDHSSNLMMQVGQVLCLGIAFLVVVSKASPTQSFAQDLTPSTPASDEKAYARSPKEIVFQNDSQWEDNRWQKTDIGPFLAASISTGKGQTLKGLAIRVGDEGEAAVCFDTARMRFTSGWTGGFLKFGPRRFGLIQPPAADGQAFFATSKLAGWAKEGRFKPNPGEISGGIEKPGNRETRLPKDWAWYRGIYTSGQRVVLSYSVGQSDVLESPWFIRHGNHESFIRSLEIGPASQTLQLLVSDSDNEIALTRDNDAIQIKQSGRQSIIVIRPHEQVIRCKILITKRGLHSDVLDGLRLAAGNPEHLSDMIRRDPGRWPQRLTTKGETSDSNGPYVVDSITLPFENPWNALFFTAGHDFFTNGDAAICTVHGDVWTVKGIDQELGRLVWRRFATGLHQPLGLRIVDDKVYVIGRNQITRLHDRNSDGEADFYENFNNDMVIAPRAHDFVTCLDTDADGNFYFIHASTGLMKVTSDGKSLTSLADGFRNPNGMGVSPNGMITAAPQQGQWTPESSLIVVEVGHYYGYGGPRITAQRKTGWDLPMCFIPRALDNSGGGQVWVEGDRWGPLKEKMLHLSYGKCQILLALTEQVGEVIQGGTIEFPTLPADFESGIMRGRFSPHDGQLYVSGLRGWQTRAIRDGCFQRVRYNGGPIHLPSGVKTYSNGIALTFSEPLDEEFAENPGNYFVQQWNYLWSKDYGSPDFSVANPNQQGRDEVPVVSATLMEDQRTVFLEMPGRQPVNQIQVSWLLRSNQGVNFRGTYAHTINALPTSVFPESEISRRERPRFVSEEVEQRLSPGLELTYRTPHDGQSDSRIGRLVAIYQNIRDPATPFLSAGPFEWVAQGTVQIPLSGFYQFRLVGNGQARLKINDAWVIHSEEGTGDTAEPVLLFKGHNRIQVHYVSPTTGTARLQLEWKGSDFGWEPVPPSSFFHDSASPGLAIAQTRRLGRELFSDLRCAACHITKQSSTAMFELSLESPDLSFAKQRFRQGWLENWILEPSKLRADSHMPAVIPTGNSSRQDAADIASYLLSLTPPVKENAADVSPDTSLLAVGEQLYEQQSCMSCHHFQSNVDPDEFNRLSLFYVNEKFPRGALVRFLQNPTTHYAATSMPTFGLNKEEALALAAFVRSRSNGKLASFELNGDPQRGQRLFSESGCQHCHSIKHAGDPAIQLTKSADLKFKENPGVGCLADPTDPVFESKVPLYELSEEQRLALSRFVQNDLASLQVSNEVETSSRLVKRLQCANCHDRDGQRSHRGLVLAEEGSGTIPESLPALTWSGEKLKSSWSSKLFSGNLSYKSRPWLKARMPSFPKYAAALATGLSLEHGIDPHTNESFEPRPELADAGNRLTLQTGLDCRQCHAVGDQHPRGDKETQIALGINLSYVRDRIRRDAYHRFMIDPPRYDIKTKMIKLSENGQTTKLKKVFDGDARQQFDAVWHFIQTLPKDPSSGDALPRE